MSPMTNTELELYFLWNPDTLLTNPFHIPEQWCSGFHPKMLQNTQILKHHLTNIL